MSAPPPVARFQPFQSLGVFEYVLGSFARLWLCGSFWCVMLGGESCRFDGYEDACRFSIFLESQYAVLADLVFADSEGVTRCSHVLRLHAQCLADDLDQCLAVCPAHVVIAFHVDVLLLRVGVGFSMSIYHSPGQKLQALFEKYYQIISYQYKSDHAGFCSLT